MPRFELQSDFAPCGDQPQAIDELVAGIEAGLKHQTLIGVTGSGKTFTMANVIARTQRPTLVIAHNKTLVAQLYEEFREFFPGSAIEYFVSFYDYYQPEAYVPSTDTYIEKESTINDEIDRLRHAATQAVSERRDVIIVASVSCIYGLGSPERYNEQKLRFEVGAEYDRRDTMAALVDMQFNRNDISLLRGAFRVRGDVLEVFPADEEVVTRLDFFGDELERISRINSLTGEVLANLDFTTIYPATHYVTDEVTLERAIAGIEQELQERLAELRRHDKLLECQRLEQRTNYDLEMLREIGFCTGIENYSRHLDGRQPGEPPFTLLDYFPEDYLLIIDESHQTIPQVGAMHAGDRHRKFNLVENGFRLPSAYDNRPLTFEEFEQRTGQIIYTSATPGPYAMGKAQKLVEQIIRPTGLVDPEISVRPTRNQIDDLIAEIRDRVANDQRTLVTTLTKRMAEDLSNYLLELDFKVHYLHSDIDTLERIEILRDLRLGKYDVVVGINLLREGLDLPEVTLVAILDADKEGFLRSDISLLQTIGRAARNVDGTVLMYADAVTGSMRRAIDETNRRRAKQKAYNETHGITPTTVRKAVRQGLETRLVAEEKAVYTTSGGSQRRATPQPDDLPGVVRALEEDMRTAAAALDFEQAAELRDEIRRLRDQLGDAAAVES